MRGLVPLGFKPGSLVRAWTPDRIALEIDVTRRMIRASFGLPYVQRVERQAVLLSRLRGLRICAGEVRVKLKPPRYFEERPA